MAEEPAKAGGVPEDPDDLSGEGIDERISWEDAGEPLPPAKRPSAQMRRCDSVSGVE